MGSAPASRFACRFDGAIPPLLLGLGLGGRRLGRRRLGRRLLRLAASSSAAFELRRQLLVPVADGDALAEHGHGRRDVLRRALASDSAVAPVCRVDVF